MPVIFAKSDTGTGLISSDIDHNATANYVADEHVAHSSVSITASGILSGGGTIVATRQIGLTNSDIDHDQTTNFATNEHFTEASIDHGNISGLSDNDHTQYVTGVSGSTPLRAGGQTLGFDETVIDHDNLTNYVIGQHRIINDSGISSTELWSANQIESRVVTATGSLTTDHGALTGLSDDDHTQYFLADSSRAFSGDLLPNASGTIDIGSLALPFRSIYLTGSSLYMDGNKILFTDGDNIVLASPDGSIVISGSVNLSDAVVYHADLTGLGNDDHTQYHTNARGDARYYTETELDAGQLDNRYYTETEIDTISGALSTEIDSDISTHESGSSHDGRYYTETEVDTWRNSVTQTEMGYLNGISSDIQTQIDAKLAIATFTVSSGDLQTNIDGKSDTGHGHSSVTITSGTIDGTVIGGTSAAAGTFTTLSVPTITEVDSIALEDNDETSHPLTISYDAAAETAYTLKLRVSDGNRILTMTGDATIADWFDQGVKVADSPQFANMYNKSEITTISGDLSSEIDSDISTHAAGSSHDGRYYTETEVDTWRNSVTQTEMGYLNGASSDIQTQIDTKLSTAQFTTSSGDIVSQIVTDHGALTGLSDDDHSQYILVDGTRELTGAWNYGSQTISGTGDIKANTLYGDGNNITNIDADNVIMARIAGSTYSTSQHMQDIFHSSGWSSGGTITSGTATSVSVAAGTGFIRPTDSAVATVSYFDWTSSGTLSVPTDTTRYIGVEYNFGSPQAVVRSSYNWDFTTDFPLGTVINEAGFLHVTNATHAIGDHASNMIQRTYETMPIKRDDRTGGLILGENGTRNITVTAGGLWERLERFSINAVVTSGTDTFDRYYQDGSDGWTKEAGQTTWNNTQYDDGDGGLATLSPNRYSAQYFYIELDGDLVSLYGQAQYTKLASAQDDTPPSTVPDRLDAHGKLIGRIIFQESAGTASLVESVFDTSFSTTLVTDHGNLAGLTDDDHTQYHNNARGDARYYTETELDAGQLDNRYHTESEITTISGDLVTQIDAKDNYSSWSFAVDGVTKDAITTGDVLDFVGGDNITVTRSADDQITISGSAGGTTTFTALTDTPVNFTNSANKVVAVNSEETALEFVAPGVTNLDGGSPASVYGGTTSIDGGTPSSF